MCYFVGGTSCVINSDICLDDAVLMGDWVQDTFK